MLLIVGTVRIPPGTLDRARTAMARMIAASRSEDGCIAYSYAEDVMQAGLIRVNEAWRDRASLDRHFASDHIRDWRAVWPELGITDRDLLLYEAGRPTAI